MKLGDNTLNKEGLSLVKTKLPMKKIANCSPYFTTLQYVNDLETQRSPQKTLISRISNFKENLSTGLKIVR